MHKVFLICFILLQHCMFAQTVGSKVSFKTVSGQICTGIITEVKPNQYKVKYDGYNFESWLTASQFQVVANTNPINTTSNQTNNGDGSGVQTIFNFGKNMGWANLSTQKKFDASFNPLTADQRVSLLNFLNGAKTNSAKFFVLKSWLAGDNFTTLQTFVNQLNQYPEAYQQEHCLISTQRSIIQQWEFSCSVTVVQTYLGELCPRYAWEVKQVANYDIAATDPYSNSMGQQQKELLEKYGGAASKRGDLSGKSIGINDALNELVGRQLGVTFSARQITGSLDVVFPAIRSQVDRGLDVPLLIGFVGTNAKHFILLMKYKQVQNDYQYLIYDPWDGKCNYVNESSIKAQSLAPLLTQWRISLDYWYPAS